MGSRQFRILIRGKSPLLEALAHLQASGPLSARTLRPRPAETDAA